ncbi:DUF7322 domain-containing protein [Haloglomus halophilum]|uniref:DUF7322 domain-containing protein n=1 Tax=Haloglomus halophilum TaxID=2962672 RepID=UPI0020C943EB|nr:hypothetical protein [Haloglomus halophilum]
MSDGDPWPDEPDEPTNPGKKYLDRFDPEAEAPEPDPEADLAPDIPDESKVPEGLFRAFWGLVATINLGLFAASLGLMLVVFRGELRNGGAVFLLGIAALAYAGWKYREVQSTDYGDDAEADEGDADTDAEGRPPADD